MRFTFEDQRWTCPLCDSRNERAIGACTGCHYTVGHLIATLKADLDVAQKLLQLFRITDLEFSLMQTDGGDCWSDSLIDVNRYLRKIAKTAGGER